MPTPGESPQCLQPGLARLIEESLPRWLCPASGLGQGTPKLSRTLWPHSHLAALSMELGASSPCGLAGCQFAARSVPTPEAAAACGTQPPGTAQVSSEVSPEPPWAGVHLVTEAPRRQSERLLHQAFQGRGCGRRTSPAPGQSTWEARQLENQCVSGLPTEPTCISRTAVPFRGALAPSSACVCCCCCSEAEVSLGAERSVARCG